MRINTLNLKTFRNYKNLKLIFNDRLNIIIGNNAQGKTNILEAIYFLSITKSFLPVNEKNLIYNGYKFCSVKANIIDDTNKKLTISLNEVGKKLEINDKEIKKHSKYIGSLKVVLFSPDNVRILKDSPNNRRKFLNIEISQLHNKYIDLLNEFNIVLKQRNEYLKVIRDSDVNQKYLEILNEKFIDLSVQICNYRSNFINELNKYINNIFEYISGYSGLNIKYSTCVDITDIENMKKQLNEKLFSSYNKEILYGNTMIGPHRDDFSLYIDDNDLSLYGSQGQIKMAVLALKLAEIDVFKNISNTTPVLLLDDLFSELDINKRNMIMKYLNIDIQTIVTTTDIENINLEYINDANIYTIENGNVVNIKDNN